MRKNKQGELILDKNDIVTLRVLLYLQIEEYDRNIKELSKIVFKSNVVGNLETVADLRYLISAY